MENNEKSLDATCGVWRSSVSAEFEAATDQIYPTGEVRLYPHLQIYRQLDRRTELARQTYIDRARHIDK